MNVTHGLRRTLVVNPRGMATTFGDRGRAWAEVCSRVARLAAAMQEAGVRKGDRTAILALNSDRYLEYYLATFWAGAVVVPLNTRWSTQENDYAMRDSDPKILFVDKTYLAEGMRLRSGNASKFDLVYIDDGETPAELENYEDMIARSNPIDDAGCGPTDLAGIFYTGGTTGAAKGVMLSHGNLVANAFNTLGEGLFGSDSVYLHAAPMFHLANGMAMFTLLMSGGSNVMLPSFTPDGVLACIQKSRITDILLVPTMIQLLVDSPSIGSYDTSSLRRIVYGASPMTETLIDRAIMAFPNAKFAQAYGMTELSPMATLLHHEQHVGEGRARGRHRSVGRPTFGVDIKVVDQNDQQVPTGSVGEVVVRGDTVTLGYWNKPEVTAEAQRNGWMHTGDGGRFDEDGFLYLADRIKDMIISGGENIYSVEVENAVAKFPGVAQCAVIGIPHEKWGEQVHAVIVPKAGAHIETEALIAFCKEAIAGYKVPRSVELVEAMPLSGAGKILKHQLRAKHAR